MDGGEDDAQHVGIEHHGDVWRPGEMAEQIGVAKAKGEGELTALLGSGDTWAIPS